MCHFKKMRLPFVFLLLVGCALALSALEDKQLREFCASKVCNTERKANMRSCLHKCYTLKQKLPAGRVIPHLINSPRHAAHRAIPTPRRVAPFQKGMFPTAASLFKKTKKH